MNIEGQLKLLLKQGEGETYYSFANADGKRWWMPARHMAVGMNLYQPSGTKGKLLKRGLPWLHWNPVVRKVLHAERIQLALGDELRELLEQIFGQQGLEFAIFGGTPSARQKITIQISKEQLILGYCKVTQNTEIYNLFQRESHILNKLNHLNVPNIPTSLFCGVYANFFLFIQSTKKTCNSKVIHIWTEKHTVYLELLHQKTKLELNFENTDFYLELKYLESVLEKQTEEAKDLFKYAICVLKKHYSTNSDFSFFHGDFTPWNIFFEKGQICVFDFEYAQNSFPPYLDRIHYIMQVWIIEQKLNAEQIFIHLEKLRLQNKIETIQIIAYLTHILSFYIKLYHGNFSSNDNGYIIWSSLLKKYITIYDKTKA